MITVQAFSEDEEGWFSEGKHFFRDTEAALRYAQTLCNENYGVAVYDNDSDTIIAYGGMPARVMRGKLTTQRTKYIFKHDL